MFLQKTMDTLKRIYLGILVIALIWILFPIQLADIQMSAVLMTTLLLLGCMMVGKVEIKYYPVLLFATMFFLRFVAVMIVCTEPVSDFELLYSSAVELTKGNNNMLDSIYYLRWAYQAGYVWYLTLLLSICNSLLFLKIINCIWSAGICVLIYFIICEIADKKVARFISLGYGLFLFPLLFNSVLSNQIPAAFLFYLALYLMFRFYKKQKRIWYYVVPGILMAFGNALRPEGIIFVCAVIGCYVLKIHKEKIRKSLLILFVFCIAYFATFQLCSLMVKYTGLNNYGLVNNEPEWKFVLGLNMETNGQYSQKDAENYLGNPVVERKVIKERLAQFDLSNVGEFLKNKERKILSAGDLSWSLLNWDDQSQIYLWLEQTNILFYLFFYLLLIISILIGFKEININMSIVYINVLAITMLVYAVIEVQARYAYIVQIAVFIIGAKGYEQLNSFAGKIKVLKKNVISNLCDKGDMDGTDM